MEFSHYKKKKKFVEFFNVDVWSYYVQHNCFFINSVSLIFKWDKVIPSFSLIHFSFVTFDWGRKSEEQKIYRWNKSWIKENKVEGIKKNWEKIYILSLFGRKAKNKERNNSFFIIYYCIPIIWRGKKLVFGGKKNCAPYFYFSSNFHFDFGDCILWVWIKMLLISTFHLYQRDKNFNLCHIFLLPFSCSLKLPQTYNFLSWEEGEFESYMYSLEIA